MKYLTMLRLALALVVVWMALAARFTPAHAQAERTLAPFAPVTGTLTSGGSEDWTYTGAAGAVISLFARSSDGTLDPQITILEGTEIVIANDDYAYPETRDAGLEAITLPRSATYTVRVSAYGATAGNYSLVLLIGYGDQALFDEFDTAGAWEAGEGTDALEQTTANSQLELTLEGLERTGSLLNTLTNFDRFYYAVDFDDVRGRGGWQVALLGRMVSDTGYAFELDSQGLWRLTRRDGDAITPVRDWATHPAIRPGEARFRLGMLVYGDHFDLFYNDIYIGSLRDSEFTRPGTVGIVLRTGSALDSNVTARLNVASVTIPATPAIFPGEVQVSSDGAVMTRELERRGVIADASPALNVIESFADLGRAGVSALPLARGESYTRFAYAANVTWESSYLEAPAGCGLVFGLQDETTYSLAYVMRNGSYGISPRLGDIFAPGIAGNLTTPPPTPVHLLVIVNEIGLHYFVDGRLVGALPNAATTEGGIGISVVNEAPVNTTCRFRDLWLAAGG
jgi:hypothetical protein